MTISLIPSLPINRWLIGRGAIFALLALLALDGGLSVNPALALSGVTITPSSVSFTGTVGPGPLTMPVTFTNVDTVPVSFTWTDSIPWIKAGYPSGTLSPGQSRTFSIAAKISGLAAGSYKGIATITAGGITKQIPVSLALSSTTTAPTIGANPAALSFTGTAGGANPTAQIIAVSSPDGGTLAWTATDNVPWLTLAPASGTNAGSVSTTINLSGLTAGTYTGTVSITATGSTTKTVPVTLTMTNSTSISGVTVTPSSVAFTGTVGATPLTIPVTFRNVGSTPVSFTWTDSIPWIKAGHPSGTLSPGQSSIFTITANISGLATGSYNGIATVTAGGITRQVPVSLALSADARPPAIGLNTTSLGFAGTAGGTNASAQTIAVSNVGGGTLSWAASDNAAWLTLSPSSGVNSGAVSANVNLTGLVAGTYNATVTVTAPGVSAKTLPVTLTITAATAANTATLTWNANTESDLAGYKVYRATGSGAYGAPIVTLPKTTGSYTATGLQSKTTYFFVVTAYDVAGNESIFSPEVSKSIF